MKPHEIAETCVTMMNANLHRQKECEILLVLPNGWQKPEGRFPRYRILQLKPDGSRLVKFNAMNMLAWLIAKGLVDVKIQTVTEC